jgi:hypothetical protein
MTARGFGIGSSIPVIRMLEEAGTRAFYVDYLGFFIDWEHRFRPEPADSPLCIQVSIGAAKLHLDGHADESKPTSEVRIPVKDLGGLAQHLRTRRPDSPDPVDPRHD